jgi:hypothetical protein
MHDLTNGAMGKARWSDAARRVRRRKIGDIQGNTACRFVAPPAGSPDLLIAKAKTTMAKMAIAPATLAAVIGRPLRCLAVPSMALIRPIGLISSRPVEVRSLQSVTVTGFNWSRI